MDGGLCRRTDAGRVYSPLPSPPPTVTRFRIHHHHHDQSQRRQGQQTSHHTLSIELTSDEDLYLLYTLELTESQYVELKREQRLVVGFAEFPGHLVELLQTCARQEEAGFQAQSNAEYRCVPRSCHVSQGHRAVTDAHTLPIHTLACRALLPVYPQLRGFLGTGVAG